MKKRLLSLGALALAILLLAHALPAFAIDETTAVRQDARAIENGTLAVGSHLIFLSSLTQQLWDTAQQSAENSEQTNIYYKSELAEGVWFDITNASSIYDISTGGTPVSDDVINALLFTHHTKSDGITYDLRTGQAVSVFEINAPYDGETLPELQPLRLQYDFIDGLGSNSINKQKLALMRGLFETKLTSPATEKADGELKGLEAYHAILKDGGAPSEEIAVVSDVMESIDAQRRVAAFEVLSTALTKFCGELFTTGEEAADIGKFSDLMEPANASIENVTSAASLYQAKVIAQGDGILTGKRFELSNRLINAAQSANWTACDAAVAQLVALSRIEQGNVVNAEAELSMLDSDLLPAAQNLFFSNARAGENDAYRTAVSQSAASVMLKAVRESYDSQLGIYLNEFEFFISARLMRLSNADGQAYLKGLIAQAAGNTGAPDSFKPYADGKLSDYAAWLQSKLQELIAAAGPSEKDLLTAQLNEQQEKRRAALDRNDLSAAKSLSGQIDGILTKISALDQKNEQALADTAAELSALQNQIQSADSGAVSNADKDALISSLSGLKKNLAEIDGILKQLPPPLPDGVDSGTPAKLLGTADELLAGLQAGSVGASLAAQKVTQLMTQTDALRTQLQPLLESGANDALAALASRLGENSGSLQAQLDGMNEQQVGLNAPVSGRISELTEQQSRQQAALGESIANTISQMKQEALSIINGSAPTAEGLASLNQKLDALSSLLPDNQTLCFPAMKSILDAMTKKRDVDETAAFDAQIDTVESLIAQTRQTFTAAQSQTLNKDALESQLAGFWASGAGEGLNANDRLVVELLALDLLYADRPVKELPELMTAKSETAGANPLVFQTMSTPTSLFAPVPSVGSLAEMRYVWQTDKRTASLVSGTTAYLFSQGQLTVGRGETVKAEQLPVAAVFRESLYIPAGYVQSTFAQKVCALADTTYSVLYVQKHEDAAKQLYELIR